MEFQLTLDELPQFAARFWEAVEGNKVFAFHGPMGAGKTTIIEALCRERGVVSGMGSPTFSIINEYLAVKNGRSEPVYHIDLYRLRDEEEVERAGVEDTVYSGSVCFVEWPEKAPSLFDEKTVHVHIEPTGEGERKLNLDLPPGV